MHAAGRGGQGSGERARARTFTGDHAAHLVEVLDAIVSASSSQGEMAQGQADCQRAPVAPVAPAPEHRGDGEIGVKVVDIASCFEPLPMLPPHMVPKQSMAGLSIAPMQVGGVQAARKACTVEASRIVLGTASRVKSDAACVTAESDAERVTTGK